MNTKPIETPRDWDEWARVRDSLKTRWVVAVLAFWITVAIMVVTFVIDNKLNLILLSIALGTMILGIWLKARFQLHRNKEPTKRQPGGG